MIHLKENKATTPLSGVYAITDGSPLPLLIDKVHQAIKGGIDLLQYRNKTNQPLLQKAEAQALLTLCRQHHIPLIINDNVALAQNIGADGVHLGQDDDLIHSARQQLGEKAIIGVSCYNSLALAITAEKNGADYVAFGSLFPSPTKPDAPRASLELLSQARQQLSTPICAIGGIDLSNTMLPFGAGADMIAVISSLFSSDDIQQSATAFQQLATAIEPS